MRRKHRLSRKASARSFRKGAVRTHRYNVDPRPMRGGIRL